MPELNSREHLADYLQTLGPKFSVGAELGVQRGLFSEHTLTKWTNCKRYYLVDAWLHQSNYEDAANLGQKDQDNLAQETWTRLRKLMV